MTMLCHIHSRPIVSVRECYSIKLKPKFNSEVIIILPIDLPYIYTYCTVIIQCHGVRYS